jgi:hypothetical protein
MIHIAELLITLIVMIMVSYIVYIEWSPVSLTFAIVACLLIHFGFSHKLCVISETTILWTIIGVSITAIALFEQTRNVPSLYNFIIVLFGIVMFSIFAKNYVFCITTVFLMFYIVSALYMRHNYPGV